MKIVRTTRYTRDMRRIGASPADMLRLETAIATNPRVGDVIPDMLGLRKLRFGLGNRGKRGGGRAIYFLLMADDTAVMVFAYAKSSQEDMTPDQRRAALDLIKEMTRD